MPFTSTTVHGPIYSPGLVALKEAKIIFDLTSWDADPEENLFVTGPYVADVDMLGNFEVTLFTNTNGINNTVYDVYVSYIDENTQQNLYDPRIKKFIGTVSLSGTGPFCISDLSFTSEHSAGSFGLYAAMEGLLLSSQTSEENAGVYAASAATDANRAETAQTDATNAAITAGNHAISADAHRAAAEVAQAEAEAARDISVAAKDIVEAGGFLTLSEADGKYIQNEGVVSVSGHFTVDTPAGAADAGFWVKHPDLAAKLQMEALDTKAAYIYMGTPTNSTAVQFFSKFNTGETVLWSDWGDGSLLRFNPGNGKTLEMRRNDTTGNEVEFYVPVTAPAPTSNDHLATKAYVDGKVPVGGGVGEAPVDGTGYVRKNNSWVAEGAAFNGGSITQDLTVDKANATIQARSSSTGTSNLNLGDVDEPNAGGVQYQNTDDRLVLRANDTAMVELDDTKARFHRAISYGHNAPKAAVDLRISTTLGGGSILLGGTENGVLGGATIGSIKFFNPDFSMGNSGGRIGGTVELRAADDFGNTDLVLGSTSTSPRLVYGDAEDYDIPTEDILRLGKRDGETTAEIAATTLRDEVGHTGFYLDDADPQQVLKWNGRVLIDHAASNTGNSPGNNTDGSWVNSHGVGAWGEPGTTLQWVETRAQLASIAEGPNRIAASFATRNNGTSGSAFASTMIGVNESVGQKVQTLYMEAIRKGASAGNTTGIELNVANLTAPVSALTDPYNSGGSGMVEGIRMAAGADANVNGTTQAVDVGIQFINNGAKFKRGLVFKHNALEREGGAASNASAISMAARHVVGWWGEDLENGGGARKEAVRMWSEVSNTDTSVDLVFKDGGVEVDKAVQAGGLRIPGNGSQFFVSGAKYGKDDHVLRVPTRAFFGTHHDFLGSSNDTDNENIGGGYGWIDNIKVLGSDHWLISRARVSSTTEIGMAFCGIARTKKAQREGYGFTGVAFIDGAVDTDGKPVGSRGREIWGFYSEAHHRGVYVPGELDIAHGGEIATANYAADFGPIYPSSGIGSGGGIVGGLTVNCGVSPEDSGHFPVQWGLRIESVNTGSQFHTGILVRDDALTLGADGRKSAMMLPRLSKVHWFDNDDNEVFSITGVGNAAENKMSMEAGNVGLSLRNSQGSTVALFVKGANTATTNYPLFRPASSGGAVKIEANGADANVDLQFVPRGTGKVRFGTHATTADKEITGYIEIKDASGTVRKLAVIN